MLNYYILPKVLTLLIIYLKIILKKNYLIYNSFTLNFMLDYLFTLYTSI